MKTISLRQNSAQTAKFSQKHPPQSVQITIYRLTLNGKCRKITIKRLIFGKFAVVPPKLLDNTSNEPQKSRTVRATTKSIETTATEQARNFREPEKSVHDRMLGSAKENNKIANQGRCTHTESRIQKQDLHKKNFYKENFGIHTRSSGSRLIFRFLPKLFAKADFCE